MKKKSKLKLISAALVAVIAIGVYSLTTNQEISIEMAEVSGSVNVPIAIDLTTKKGPYEFNPKQMTITISHKYNSDETYKFEAVPYTTGQYQLIFYPNYSGEYKVAIELTTETDELYLEQFSVVIN